MDDRIAGANHEGARGFKSYAPDQRVAFRRDQSGDNRTTPSLNTGRCSSWKLTNHTIVAVLLSPVLINIHGNGDQASWHGYAVPATHRGILKMVVLLNRLLRAGVDYRGK
jgi:hypothetical protein